MSIRAKLKPQGVIGNVRDTKDAAEQSLANQRRIIELLEQLLAATKAGKR